MLLFSNTCDSCDKVAVQQLHAIVFFAQVPLGPVETSGTRHLINQSLRHAASQNKEGVS